MNRLLYLGCSPGEDVRLLQNDLNSVTALPSQKSGLAPLVADGSFGSKTGGRVREFQSMNGLTADGVVGPKTLDALHSALQEVPGAAAEPVKGAASPPAYSGGPPYGKPVPPSGGKTYTSAGTKSYGGSPTKSYGGSGAGGGSGSGSGGGTKNW